MDSIQGNSLPPLAAKIASLQAGALGGSQAPAGPAESPIGGAIAPQNQDSATVGGGQASSMDLGNWKIQAELAKKLAKAARGEVDLDCLPTDLAPSKPSTPGAGNSGWSPGMLMGGGITDANAEQYSGYGATLDENGTQPFAGSGNQGIGNSGWSLGNGSGIEDNGPGDGAGDPLVFDLNQDGDTDATVNQHGIDVDGLKSTKWAEKGDGVLAMGDEPLDTEGGKYQDAFENLRDKAVQAGIDVSKGYLDEADLQKLEAQGLTMLVSNGDGTNTPMKPTELGITQMSLGGKKVDTTDSVGNKITEQGSFVRNGQTNVVNDMWFNQI